jgi:bacterial/archaeal transporter family protein
LNSVILLPASRVLAVQRGSRSFMHWITASLVSAVFLGFYELCTKHAVRENAVLPVLFLSTFTGAAVWSVLLAVQAVQPCALPAALQTDALTLVQHLQLALKSAIVTASWIFTYFALKHLPLSLGSPIRAMSPLFTWLGALVLLGERPTLLQTLGVLTTLGSFVGLSLAGAREGIRFHRNKWIGFLLVGTVLGATSGLYDKYLLGRAGFSVPTVQAWFSVYLVLFFLPFGIGWKLRWWERNAFHWRWSIPLIALFLLVADYLYFGALRRPGSLVSIVMSLRRGSTLVGFAGGIFLFREAHGWQKLPAVLGILAGIVMTVLG